MTTDRMEPLADRHPPNTYPASAEKILPRLICAEPA